MRRQAAQLLPERQCEFSAALLQSLDCCTALILTASQHPAQDKLVWHVAFPPAEMHTNFAERLMPTTARHPIMGRRYDNTQLVNTYLAAYLLSEDRSNVAALRTKLSRDRVSQRLHQH